MLITHLLLINLELISIDCDRFCVKAHDFNLLKAYKRTFIKKLEKALKKTFSPLFLGRIQRLS